MKKIAWCLMLACSITSSIYCQTKAQDNPKVTAQIIAMEKAGWQAWKERNVTWFRHNTTATYMQVFGEGIRSKAEVLKYTADECTVTNYALKNFKCVMLSESVAVLTYVASQNAVCGGIKSVPWVRVAVNYVKQGNRWYEAFYMETPTTP